jgi:hypothetical protein
MSGAREHRAHGRREVMRRFLKCAALALAATMTMATASTAQTRAEGPSRLEFAFTYQGTMSDAVSGSHFWMQGGAAQIHGRFYGGLGVVADVAGAHIANINSSGVGLDMVTATFGPRYTWRHARFSVYGQGLLGEAIAFNSVFPNPAGAMTAANSLAVKAGGGVNVNLAPHFALRLVEADYLRTQLPNSTTNAQNNLTLGAGVVLRFR